MAPVSRNNQADSDIEPPGIKAGPLDHLAQMARVMPLQQLAVDFTTGDVWLKIDLGAIPGDPVMPDEQGDQADPVGTPRAAAPVPGSPPRPPLSQFAREILDALGRTPDEIVGGDEICRRVGGNATINRSFYRATAELRDHGLIESFRGCGFRLVS